MVKCVCSFSLSFFFLLLERHTKSVKRLDGCVKATTITENLDTQPVRYVISVCLKTSRRVYCLNLRI